MTSTILAPVLRADVGPGLFERGIFVVGGEDLVAGLAAGATALTMLSPPVALVTAAMFSTDVPELLRHRLAHHRAVRLGRPRRESRNSTGCRSSVSCQR